LSFSVFFTFFSDACSAGAGAAAGAATGAEAGAGSAAITVRGDKAMVADARPIVLRRAIREIIKFSSKVG
jgi:hypothetical protein